MSNTERKLARVGGGFLGLVLGVVLGGGFGYITFREASPARSYQENPGDWYGGMLDAGGRVQVGIRNAKRAAIGSALGGAVGLAAGIGFAARAGHARRPDAGKG